MIRTIAIADYLKESANHIAIVCPIAPTICAIVALKDHTTLIKDLYKVSDNHLPELINKAMVQGAVEEVYANKCIKNLLGSMLQNIP